ncbi:OsmC family protein [Sphingobacterium psychroaquaticum]|uniref:Putative redox protein n=1 Tax=Sphingobacterium psychroaquaticum TaxID=561061 RepID=A0A1X7IMW7_9SPHI|nr:OsmC family protein [Sphingobacterium psychroaquaticum]QBQ41398.1 OsmC family peroxiredoxin [Sphingobacterium psychroaquaticum]SMG16062.1 putative redox protein [Sphingobacterium psychroaquaticum]
MERNVSVKIGKDRYKTEVQIAQHHIIADEPKEVGGTDFGPSPKELFLSSLGTCKVMTVRMYADRKGWPLDGVEIELSLSTQKAELQNTTFVHCRINLLGDLDDMQRQRLLAIADKCPIHKILNNPVIIESSLL